MHRDPAVELHLSLAEAQTLHALLEDLLEKGVANQPLEHTYRLLGWRIVATRGGSGLTGRIAALAREADSLEQYEVARDDELGPLLDGLEGAENRDP